MDGLEKQKNLPNAANGQEPASATGAADGQEAPASATGAPRAADGQVPASAAGAANKQVPASATGTPRAANGQEAPASATGAAGAANRQVPTNATGTPRVANGQVPANAAGAANAAQAFPPQFEKVAAFSLKTNPYTVWVNVLGALLFIGIVVAAIFLFPLRSEDLLRQIVYWALVAIGGVLLAFAALLLTMPLKLLFLKRAGGGKSKLLFGALIDVFAELPVKRNRYILADAAGLVLFLCALAVLAALWWNALTFIALSFLLVNALGNIPIYLFELKQPKECFLWFDRGILYSLKKLS